MWMSNWLQFDVAVVPLLVATLNRGKNFATAAMNVFTSSSRQRPPL